ncbi:hypothetical protein [Pseudomonas aeruginosa]|uniref:hypothetical protein n=1 Tax=Pseudomonas aeruginosa TaxID=287 RepID=UPI003D7F34E7
MATFFQLQETTWHARTLQPRPPNPRPIRRRKAQDETLPGSTDATSSTAPEASAAKPQTAPATEKRKDELLDSGRPSSPALERRRRQLASDGVEGIAFRRIDASTKRPGWAGRRAADGVLSDEQLEALESDPLLRVERCTFSGNQEGE